MSCSDTSAFTFTSTPSSLTYTPNEKTVLMNPISQLSHSQLIQLQQANEMKNHHKHFRRQNGRRNTNYYQSNSDIITHKKSQLVHMKPSRSCVTQSTATQKIIRTVGGNTNRNCYQFNRQVWYHNLYRINSCPVTCLEPNTNC